MAEKVSAESGVQLLARLSTRPLLTRLETILFPEDLQPGEIVQVSGNSGTGKTFLLLHLMTKCLLPNSYEHLEIGGLGVHVILIDTEHNISILKLVSLMEQFIFNSKHNGNENNSVTLRNQEIAMHVEDIVKQSLNRLIILKTYSSMQLQMNFHSLGKILTSNTKISLLMIDSLTSYYWQDTLNPKSYKKMDLYLKIMIEKLQKCIKDFKIVTIFIKQEYFQSKHGEVKVSEINHKIDLRKSESNDGLFCAIIDSTQSNYHFSISDKGFTWVIL